MASGTVCRLLPRPVARVLGGACRALSKKAKKAGKRLSAEPAASSASAKPGSRGGAAGGTGVAGNIVMTLNNVSKRVPGRALLDGVSLSFLHGAKIGVLGANGAGKSTLLKVIAGIDREVDGDVWLKPGLTLGYLHQEPQLDASKDALANVLDGVRDKYELVRRYDQIATEMGGAGADVDALIGEQAEVADRIDALNCWDIVRDVQSAMRNLKCPSDSSDVTTLSGGERRRVALCRLLLSQPDVLLLDEPTNHLDASSVAWLEGFLSAYPGAVLAVTHDRYFLENIAGWILEVQRGQALPYHTNYSGWLRAKAVREAQRERQEDAHSRHMARELEWISQAARGGQRKGRARIAAFERAAAASSAADMSRKLESGAIVIVPGPRLGANVLELVGASKARGERTLFDGLSLRLEAGDVLGVVGANGSGKSTLLRLIDGSEAPDAGEIRLGATVQLAHVSQSRGGLTASNTVYEEISEGQDLIAIGADGCLNARAYVSSFNLRGPAQEKKVGLLSGGERGRVHLAKALKSGCNLLLLDEPTNDLDVDTLRSLEEALSEYDGSAVVVSHDRWFLDRVCTHLLLLHEDGRTTFFAGSWGEYEAHVARAARGTGDGVDAELAHLSEAALSAARTAGRRGI
ncbi:hypothetical protein KFE25_010565 [Diacronema lutheri]|uniref:ABC transporter domain-containing protein n=1 Tax=Diacronema lutheri TaxID=2081491 RepID=A0A8J6CBD9_DIALT|nr:hypothetical protein KFE25_010565 [Diacronema lutheri]